MVVFGRRTVFYGHGTSGDFGTDTRAHNVAAVLVVVQGYLTYKKTHPLRTLP